MAKPIEPTPTLYGEDANRVLTAMRNVASTAEIARRREAARKFAEMVTSSSAVEPKQK